jgi:hypothetical protein
MSNQTIAPPQWEQAPTPQPPTPKQPRSGWIRRNLGIILGATALVLSVIALNGNGAPGPRGAQGVQGPQGIQGSQGVQGAAGATGKASTVAPAPKVTTAPKPAPAAEFGEGVYKVGTDISPGAYKGTVEDGNGYWARLSSSDTSDILANDLKTTGTMYLTVRSSDKYIEISGVTFTKVS